jgi:soluble cytochrome b562
MTYKQLLNKAAGKDGEFSMEHRIFNCAIAASIATLIPSFVFMLFQDFPLANVVLFIASGLYLYIYYLCRFANKLQRAVLVFSLTGASLLNIMWVLDRGAMGSTGFFISVAILVVVFTAQKPLRYIVGMLINLFLLVTFDEYIQNVIPWRMPASTIGQEASLISSLVYLSILIMLYKGLIHKKMDNTYKGVMNQLMLESSTANKTADDLAQISEQLLAHTLQQKTATEQLSVTTEELGATAQQNSHLANSAMMAIKNTEQNIYKSQDIIDGLTQSIDKIQHSSEEIQSINNVINDISYQTNILSLNAMIEASRAEGISGGFKVVALEIKRLSERSAKAADSINKLLANNFGYVQKGVEQAEVMKGHFQEITHAIHPLTETIQNVSDASVEQHEAIRQITTGIDDIDMAVEENKKLAAEGSLRSKELRDNAKSLIEVVSILDNTLKE